MSNERKHAHLGMIQAVVTRMASNSFQMKGWAIVLVTALLGLIASGDDVDTRLAYAGLLPTIAFWALDAYFLHQERLFRKLYDHVRKLDDADVDYSMNTLPFADQVVSPAKVAISQTLLWFYAPLAAIVVVVALVTNS